MKRKAFQKPISTLIIGASVLAGGVGITSPTYATDISASAVDQSLLPVGTEIDGKRYWTVAEMQIASELINAKREEFCQGDRMCEEELPWQQMDEFGGIYRALDPYENLRFMLTSVNPSANTVSFLYHDEDKMLSRMLGESVRHDIASIYAVWVDESLGSITSTSSNWLAYGQRAPYHLGTVEEVEAATHLVFDESETELGHGWFTPNVEREYHVEGSNLIDNTNGQIHFSLNATDGGGHSHGTLNYSSCLNSPDYTDGMECKLLFAEDGSSAYFPVTPGSTTNSEPVIDKPEPTVDPEPTPNLEPATEPAVEDNPTTEPTTSDSTEISNEPTATSTETKEHIIYSIIKEPTLIPTSSPSYTTNTTSRVAYVTNSTTNPTTEKQGTTILTKTDEADNATKPSEPTTDVEVPLAATSTAAEEEHTFPWWLIVLMFFGSAFFIFSWWFLLPLFKNTGDRED